MAITSLTDYKAYLGVTDTVTSRDAAWTVMLTSAQKMLQAFCDRQFDSATWTERHSGDGSEVILVRNPPITSVTSITLYGVDGSTSVYDSGDYRADTDQTTGAIYRLGAKVGRFAVDDYGFVEPSVSTVSPCWPAGDKNLSVVYVGGYSSQTMPDDLKQLVWEMVDWMYAKRGRDPEMQSENIGPYSYSRGGSNVGVGAYQLAWWQWRALPYRRGA